MSQKSNLTDVKDILDLIKMKIDKNEEYFAKKNPNGVA